MLANGLLYQHIQLIQKNYKYLIEDCEPSIVIVSNNEMHNKLKKNYNEKNFIKKIITFEKIEKAFIDEINIIFNFNSIIKKLSEE